MSKKVYVPKSDSKFLEWVKFLIQYVTEHAERFRIFAPDWSFTEWIERFALCLQKCADPNHGRLDVVEKNELRKQLEKASRELVRVLLFHLSDIQHKTSYFHDLVATNILC